MDEARTERLRGFVDWVVSCCTGDEKGQAQIYLDRLFQAFGHAGSLDVGGEPEFRVRKPAESGGGTSFADYVWKPIVLIEMKKRGVVLSKHYRQAFDYWTRLVPGRPRYVVLCNFDEFEVYDFETQMDSPVGRLKLADLPEHYGPLAFLLPGQPPPVFDNQHEPVTRAAAGNLAKCFNKFIKRGVDRSLAQRFILQTLVAFFAEDIGLMEQYLVTRLLEDLDEKNSFDVMGGLFRAMNNPTGNAGGRFKDVPYFNGGVFANPAEMELTGPEIVLLKECSMSNWSKVRPEIFGTVFESTLGKDERHAQGAHFTHPADIMKIIGPTIVEPWRQQIDEAKTLKRLGELLMRLQNFRVLDPACGSGNFLYLAYRELKRLEARIFERIDAEFPSKAEPQQLRMSYLSVRNFFGMDINPFAVELAKVTMMVARKLAIDELHVSENALPLDNLDKNFIATDALYTRGPDGTATRTAWPQADVIIGNPPFLGAKRLKPELGPDYVKTLRKLYREVPGMADFCVYWIRRSHDHIATCTAGDPVSGRAGLVGTQNIRNNKSRVGGLDHVVKDGTIIEAVDNQPWSGEAAVNVSIVNWVKAQRTNENALLMPTRCSLWKVVDGEPTITSCASINSSLSEKIDVSTAQQLSINKVPKRVFQGITPGHAGFVLTPQARQNLISLEEDASSAEVIHPYLVGNELVVRDGTPSRYVIDFQARDILQAQQHSKAFAHIQKTVLPARELKAEKGRDAQGRMRPHHKQFLNRWWRLSWPRSDMFQRLASLKGRYIACSRATLRPIFAFISTAIWPGDKLQIFVFDDDYSFGVLQSSLHWDWLLAKCGFLGGSTPSYSPNEVFDTLAWPQHPDPRAVIAVSAAAREIRRVRAEALPKRKGGLRALYRTLELPGENPLKDAHAALDDAVLKAYGFDPKADLLAQVLALNQAVAAQIAAGQPVTAPGVPPSFPNPEALITDDCIRPS